MRSGQGQQEELGGPSRLTRALRARAGPNQTTPRTPALSRPPEELSRRGWREHRSVRLRSAWTGEVRKETFQGPDRNRQDRADSWLRALPQKSVPADFAMNLLLACCLTSWSSFWLSRDNGPDAPGQQPDHLSKVKVR